MKNIIDKKLCTGCYACFFSCPNKSIKMESDKYGFPYPEIDNTCIQCGKCKNICPRINVKNRPKDFVQKAFAAISKDFNIWKRSSSGGAFSEICNAFGDEQTLVCGATWDGFSVTHKCIIGISNIAELCKSKYIQSNINDTYIEVKNYLENGGRAIFCGTPCQVAGIQSFLGKSYSQLLLIDLICHGVGSPAVLESCIKGLEKDFSKRIMSYEFRSKMNLYYQDHITKLEFDDKDTMYIIQDRYIQLFTMQHCLRESCGENCIYRNENRQGDVTIGDFKGLANVFPNLTGTKRNYSTIIINNEKGELLLPKLTENMVMHSCKVDDIKKYNPLFYRHTYFSQARSNFFIDFDMDSQYAIEKWTIPPKEFKRSIKGKIFDLLPQGYRQWFIRRAKK